MLKCRGIEFRSGKSPKTQAWVLVQISDKCMFFWQNDFLGLCRQDLRPERWSGRWLSGQGFEVELIFLNFLCQLNAANRHGRRLESLESEHRPDPLFYPAMVLLDDVIQVLARAYPHAARQGSGRFQFGDRQMRGGVPVQGDHPGTSIIPHCQGEEPLGCSHVTPLA